MNFVGVSEDADSIRAREQEQFERQRRDADLWRLHYAAQARLGAQFYRWALDHRVPGDWDLTVFSGRPRGWLVSEQVIVDGETISTHRFVVRQDGTCWAAPPSMSIEHIAKGIANWVARTGHPWRADD
jgi:hypothetical protein